MLVKIWKDINKGAQKMKTPSILYKDMSFVQRVLRDITDEDVDQIIVDSKDHLKEVEKFTQRYLPGMKGKVRLYDADIPLFEQYGVDNEVERALSNKVYLRSGGSFGG